MVHLATHSSYLGFQLEFLLQFGIDKLRHALVCAVLLRLQLVDLGTEGFNLSDGLLFGRV